MLSQHDGWPSIAPVQAQASFAVITKFDWILASPAPITLTGLQSKGKTETTKGREM